MVLFQFTRKGAMIMFDIPKAHAIKKIIVENSYVKTFVFEANLCAKPGQFVNLWLPRIDEKPMSIAYSDENEFWVTMFAVGDFSRKMHQLQVGDLVGVRGPYGTHFRFQQKQRLVMMAGGYGAAPLYFLTTEALKQDCQIDFVIGARSSEHLLYLDRIGGLKNVTFHITTDDGSKGIKGYNVLVLEQLIASKKRFLDCVYACGPELMLKRISEICDFHNLSAQISIERYMKCGFGICGQCCVDPGGQRMCKEGPVVDNKLALKIAEFGKYHRDSVGKAHSF